MKNINKIIFAIFMISVLLLPVFASAYTFLESLPGLKTINASGPSLSEYLRWLFNFTLIGTGFLAVLMIVIGGVRYMIGGASESERTAGKAHISSALWGLLLALGAWLILYTINPELIKLDFALPPSGQIQQQNE